MTRNIEMTQKEAYELMDKLGPLTILTGHQSQVERMEDDIKKLLIYGPRDDRLAKFKIFTGTNPELDLFTRMESSTMSMSDIHRFGSIIYFPCLNLEKNRELRSFIDGTTENLGLAHVIIMNRRLSLNLLGMREDHRSFKPKSANQYLYDWLRNKLIHNNHRLDLLSHISTILMLNRTDIRLIEKQHLMPVFKNIIEINNTTTQEIISWLI